MDMWRFKHIIHASWVTRWEHKKTLAYCACGIAEQRRPLDKKEWPSRKVFVLGEKNIKNVPLIIREKVLLPPLHIKLGLIKKFVKALDKVGECFKHFFTKFSQLSYEVCLKSIGTVCFAQTTLATVIKALFFKMAQCLVVVKM